ncbi:MAG: secondary thiamine-phosphate synthase enzyme YjbQ [Ginsengibacter sp.]|jgi:secondary thiamine-phosphate synthase enzyme
MKMVQKKIKLQECSRGFHLVTDEILRSMPEIKEITTGMFQAFIQHTSASLCINENADPTVRIDFEMWYHKAVPENDPEYKHNYEGPDDMPAHLKASMLGSSVLIPISNGSLSLGMWQGIYLGEHRDRGGRRNIVITVWGE